jgi:hypothetical protein
MLCRIGRTVGTASEDESHGGSCTAVCRRKGGLGCAVSRRLAKLISSSVRVSDLMSRI